MGTTPPTWLALAAPFAIGCTEVVVASSQDAATPRDTLADSPDTATISTDVSTDPLDVAPLDDIADLPDAVPADASDAPAADAPGDDRSSAPLLCSAGFGDCDDDRSNGCETDTLRAASHCGACGNACADGGRCVFGACVAPCAPGTVDCYGTGQCLDLATSISACGACGRRCTTSAGATSTCVDGACGFSCRSPYGYADCDGDPANDCETYLPASNAHCGACGHACAVDDVCIDGVCHPPCSATNLDCDYDGRCESDTQTSPTHCGACGRACALPNVVPACVSGACTIDRCVTGFGDCDGAPANGCEVDLSTNDGAHCGACGRRCAVGEACVSGTCSLPAPRQWRPQSVSITTTRRPTFAWHLPAGIDGARLEVCADRACTRVEHTVDVTGESYRPPASVIFNEGVHYWRLWSRAGDRVAAAHGPTWLFRAPATDAAYDTAWRRIDDVDGDGVDESGDANGFTLSSTRVRWTPDAWRETSEDGYTDHSATFDFAGDLDGDGYGDLVGVSTRYVQRTSYGFVYEVAWVRGGPTGLVSRRWERISDIAAVASLSTGHRSLAVTRIGDIDGDGGADVIVARINGDVPVALADFFLLSSSRSAAVSLGSRLNGEGISLGDIDGDGRSDALLWRRWCDPAFDSDCAARVGLSAALTDLPPCGASATPMRSDPVVDDFNADGLADLSLHDADWTRRIAYRYYGTPAGFTADRCELLPAP